jgi:hypothetical protein
MGLQTWLELDSSGSEDWPKASSCFHENETSGSIKGGKYFYCEIISFSRRPLLHRDSLLSYCIRYCFGKKLTMLDKSDFYDIF